MDKDIFSYIQGQESNYKKPIPINDVWNWSMTEHIKTTELYTNSQTRSGKDNTVNDFTPVKNITKPILNLQHRTEDIEVKDVQIYVDEADRYHLSFLVKKYHDDVFTQENDIDSYFDELNVSRIDFGAGLSKKLNKPCPEVVPLQSIVFCDQTDILSGPIGIKHYYSPDQLLDMVAKGWGNPKNGATISVKELIKLARDEKKDDINNDIVTKTPGRYIEVYEVHGNLPKRFTDPLDDSEEYETCLFICAFYTKKDNSARQGVILYYAPEKESPFKLIKRDPVYGRALGFGGAEELFESQVWTNYDMIRMQDMKDAASKTVILSEDPAFTQRNKIRDLDNMEVLDVEQGKNVRQMDTFPRNYSLFDKSMGEWELHAKEIGGAQDPIQGNAPASGTPFVSLQAQIQQGMGLHQYRRMIFARHLEEVYRDWIIPEIQRKITEGTTFLSELSLDELQMVGEAMVNNQVNKVIKEKILNGELIDPNEIDQIKQQLIQQFQKRGNKHFIEILKGEFKDTQLGVKVSIAGKNKDLAGMVDKLTKVFQTIIASPYILQSPPIAKLFNKIIEASGLDPIDLSNFKVPPLPARTMRTTIDYKDLATPPTDTQEQVLELSGLQPSQGGPTGQPPQRAAQMQPMVK